MPTKEVITEQVSILLEPNRKSNGNATSWIADESGVHFEVRAEEYPNPSNWSLPNPFMVIALYADGDGAGNNKVVRDFRCALGKPFITRNFRFIGRTIALWHKPEIKPNGHL